MYNWSEYTSLTMHRLRERELINKADQERLAMQRLIEPVRRLRRSLRINNN